MSLARTLPLITAFIVSSASTTARADPAQEIQRNAQACMGGMSAGKVEAYVNCVDAYELSLKHNGAAHKTTEAMKSLKEMAERALQSAGMDPAAILAKARGSSSGAAPQPAARPEQSWDVGHKVFLARAPAGPTRNSYWLQERARQYFERAVAFEGAKDSVASEYQRRGVAYLLSAAGRSDVNIDSFITSGIEFATGIGDAQGAQRLRSGDLADMPRSQAHARPEDGAIGQQYLAFVRARKARDSRAEAVAAVELLSIIGADEAAQTPLAEKLYWAAVAAKAFVHAGELQAAAKAIGAISREQAMAMPRTPENTVVLVEWLLTRNFVAGVLGEMTVTDRRAALELLGALDLSDPLAAPVVISLGRSVVRLDDKRVQTYERYLEKTLAGAVGLLPRERVQLLSLRGLLLARRASTDAQRDKAVARLDEARAFVQAKRAGWDADTQAVVDMTIWGMRATGMALLGRTRDQAEAEFEHARAQEAFSGDAAAGGMLAPLTYGTAAQLFAASGAPERAREALEAALRRLPVGVEFVLNKGNERVRLAAASQLRTLADEFASLSSAIPDGPALAARYSAGTKGLVLELTAGQGARLLGRTDGASTSALAELRAAQAKLSRAIYSPGATASDAAIESARRELSSAQDKAAAAAGGGASFRAMTTGDIAAALPKGGVFVDIVRHRDARPTGVSYFDRPELYTAIVVPAKGEPRAIELGPAGALDEAIAELRAALTDPTRAREDIAQLAKTRMPALMEALGGGPAIVSPDGEFNALPLAALAAKGVGDVRYVTSARDLEARRTTGDKTAPLLVGGVDFGPTPSTGVLRFSPLPGTEQEVDAIAELVDDPALLKADGATRDALVAARAPAVLHVATHGFFVPRAAIGVPAGDAAAPAAPDDRGLELELAPAPAQAPTLGILSEAGPMLRSGLAVAGANERTGERAGIVTALEISTMDLQATDLVVLSACETGLGDSEPGEGVFGLRRALGLAGASTQVLSLWKVDDAATKALMTEFYKRLDKGDSSAKALRAAQAKIAGEAKWAHPYYWAAFVHAGVDAPVTLEASSAAAGTSTSGSSEEGSGARSRLRVRDYWRNPPSAPRAAFEGGYIGGINTGDHQGVTAEDAASFYVRINAEIAPRWIAGLDYERSTFTLKEGAGDSTLIGGRFGLLVGVDVLGLPRTWPFRPSLNTWVAAGLGWGKYNPPEGSTTPLADDGRKWGIAAIWGADLKLHIRVTDRADIRLGGGITRPWLAISGDNPIETKGILRNWRWTAGGGFGLNF